MGIIQGRELLVQAGSYLKQRTTGEIMVHGKEHSMCSASVNEHKKLAIMAVSLY